MKQSSSQGENILSSEQIEFINAHGPYSMAIWRSGKIAIGDEELLAGRASFIAERVRRAILQTFNLDEIRGLSIIDVGCYDGWLLHQLSDLPFARMVGLEPREKNIAKGKVVREALAIPTRVEFEVGGLESLGTEQFDILICSGVLYHVESIPAALRQLRSACRKMIFIESRCLSSRHITAGLRHEMEMRDIAYKFHDLQCGVIGHKFESSYHDGSATSASVVSVPTVETLLMYLEMLRFEKIEVVADPETYRNAVWKNRRPLGGVCISALVPAQSAPVVSEERTWIDTYESRLAATVLSADLLKWLSAILHLRTPSVLLHQFLRMAARLQKDEYAREILANLQYSPRDKLALEQGKRLYGDGRYEESIAVLQSVTRKINADWRAVFRSCALLSLCYANIGKAEQSERYRSLCLTCNPRYPIDAVAKEMAKRRPSV